MNSHDIGRGRGGIASALSSVTAKTLVVGIESDRLFPVEGQNQIAQHINHTLDADEAIVLESPYGHDGFLIETEAIGRQLRRLLP